MWGLLGKNSRNDNEREISFMDVKELYDAAYAEKSKIKVNLKKFKKLIEEAAELNTAYRAQLAITPPFQYGRVV